MLGDFGEQGWIVADGNPAERKIQPAICQHRREHVAGAHLHGQRNRRVAQPDLPKGREHIFNGRTRYRTDLDSARHALLQLLDITANIGNFTQDAGAAKGHLLPGLGQPYPAARASVELRPHQSLGLRDQTGDGRLAHVQRRRRMGQLVLSRKFGEQSDMGQLQAFSQQIDSHSGNFLLIKHTETDILLSRQMI